MLHRHAQSVCALQDGTTALHLAAHSGSAQAVQLLINSGVSVHAQNCDDQTPLFEAAAAGHVQAAMALLQNGSDAGVQLSASSPTSMSDLTFISSDMSRGDMSSDPFMEGSVNSMRQHSCCADHKDKDGLTAADRAPPQLAALLREPQLALEGGSALLQAPAQQPGPTQQEPGSQQGGLMSRLWSGLPSLGLLRSSTSSEPASHSEGSEPATRWAHPPACKETEALSCLSLMLPPPSLTVCSDISCWSSGFCSGSDQVCSCSTAWCPCRTFSRKCPIVVSYRAPQFFYLLLQEPLYAQDA